MAEIQHSLFDSAYERDRQRVLSKIQAKPGIQRAALLKAVHLSAAALDRIVNDLATKSEAYAVAYPTAGRRKLCYWPGPCQTQPDGITTTSAHLARDNQPPVPRLTVDEARRLYDVGIRLKAIGVSVTYDQVRYVLA